MGFQDRDYYRESPSYGGGFRASGQRMLVTNLVILNAAIFLIDAFTPVTGVTLDGRVAARWLDDLLALDADALIHPWKLWQVATYGFVHAPLGSRSGIWHVGMNMFMLWMFGRDIELVYGRREFLRFYLAALMLAGLAWLAVRTASGAGAGGIVGASGAVTAVLILFVLNFPRRTLYLWGLVAVPAWLAGALWILLDLFGAAGGGRGEVAYEAHLAGAAFALAYHRLGWRIERWTPWRWSSLAAWPAAWVRRRPKLRVHRPDAEPDDDAEADRILAKVYREGQDSLTARERRILEAYSRRVRERRGRP